MVLSVTGDAEITQSFRVKCFVITSQCWKLFPLRQTESVVALSERSKFSGFLHSHRPQVMSSNLKFPAH